VYEIKVSKEIQAPKEKVFESFSDLRHAAEVIEGIEKVEIFTEGPMALGTRWRETRVMFGKEATEEMEITGFDSPNSYTAEAESHGCHYVTRFDFETKGDGTEVTMTFQGQPLTLIAKIFNFILSPMMKGSVRKCLGKDLDDLKQHLEASSAAST
jgi:carbon monoxide dehydrogenase subunit G